MDANEAERLARSFVGTEARLTLSSGPPDGLYQASPADAEFFFFVGQPRQCKVGGDEVIAMDRSTGHVRLAGHVGE